MTEDHHHRDLDSSDNEPARGRLIGDLKLELINPGDGWNAPKDNKSRRLKYLALAVNVLTLAAVVFYGYQAWDANRLARRTLATTQRAHLGIKETQITAYRPDEFRITFDLENQGSSAGTDTRLILRVTDWDAVKVCKLFSVSKSIDFGSFPFQTGTSYHSSVPFDGFTNQQWTDITTHRSFLKITGLLEYNDGFSQSSRGWNLLPI